MEAEVTVTIVEELSGLVVSNDIVAALAVIASAEVKRDTVLLGTLGGAAPWALLCL